MNHLESRGVQRRRNTRKPSDAKVALDAGQYAKGLSLVSAAKEFGLNQAPSLAHSAPLAFLSELGEAGPYRLVLRELHSNRLRT